MHLQLLSCGFIGSRVGKAVQLVFGLHKAVKNFGRYCLWVFGGLLKYSRGSSVDLLCLFSCTCFGIGRSGGVAYVSVYVY